MHRPVAERALCEPAVPVDPRFPKQSEADAQSPETAQELPHVLVGAAAASGAADESAAAAGISAANCEPAGVPAAAAKPRPPPAALRALALGLVADLAQRMGDAAPLLEALGGVAARLPGPGSEAGPGSSGGGGGDLGAAALDCLLAAAGALEALPPEVRPLLGCVRVWVRVGRARGAAAGDAASIGPVIVCAAATPSDMGRDQLASRV